MALTLTHALLLNLDPVGVSPGALRIEDGIITHAGPDAAPAAGDETLDCAGAVVLPGLVNGHTHLYSALAAGMPAPRKEPRTFHEILQFVWWRLDRALDAESIEFSARIGALDALRCGTTTLIDHHASPHAIEGSLDRLERGIGEVGLRAVLCYETTDRNGPAGVEAGLAENRRYLDKCGSRSGGRFAALVGAHAAFTMSDATLAACVELARTCRGGVHIHVAEDPCDDAICRRQYGAPLVARLRACGLLPAETGRADDAVARSSILAHGTHLSPAEAEAISAAVAAVAHNPRSNMNNRVGYAPVGRMSRVQLGTDGIGGDLFAEARHAWFKARDAARRPAPAAGGANPAKPSEPAQAIRPRRIVEMLAQAASTAGNALGCTLGRLAPGAAGDVVVTDYVPATPLATENAPAHLIFALGAQHVRDVLIAGQWVLKNRKPTRVDGRDVRGESVGVARALWARMQALAD